MTKDGEETIGSACKGIMEPVAVVRLVDWEAAKRLRAAVTENDVAIEHFGVALTNEAREMVQVVLGQYNTALRQAMEGKP
jgi:hypothetical protein